MEYTLYYCKGKLLFMLFAAVGICTGVIFSGYYFLGDDFILGHGSMYLMIVLGLLVFIKITPALFASEPALRINTQGFFATGFLMGMGQGWIGWDEVEVLGKQHNFVSVILKNPKATKERLSWFYKRIPTFRTPLIRIGPAFSLGLTSQDLFVLFDEKFNHFRNETKAPSERVSKDQGTQKHLGFSGQDSGGHTFTVYGIHYISRGFITSIVLGPGSFKYAYSDSLYRYEDIKEIKKNFYSPDPHFVGQILDRFLGKLVPRLIIKMKDGGKIWIDHYITREDRREVCDGYQPTEAFYEIEHFLNSKMSDISKHS